MQTHLQREIGKLKRYILDLSLRVEKSVSAAVHSVVNHDEALAREVIEADRTIDTMEVDLEEECLKILALHQPVAVDLRFIVAVLKINNDLERIGDLAVNIAECEPALHDHDGISSVYEMPAMAHAVRDMLHKSIEALVNLDVAKARMVCEMDGGVDDMHHRAVEGVRERIESRPDRATFVIALLDISRQLERIADHVTNISEDIIYMVEGQITRHQHV